MVLVALRHHHRRQRVPARPFSGDFPEAAAFGPACADGAAHAAVDGGSRHGRPDVPARAARICRTCSYYLFEWFGDSPAFLDYTNAFRTLIVIEVLQWTPFAFLLFYVAYIAIPADVHEAAALDGATGLQRLWRIDLPLMVPTLVVAFFIRFIDGFRVFDNVYALTGSGAGGSTTSLSIYIYQAFFKEGAIGKAVAASVVLFITSLLVLYGLNWLGARRKR